MALLTSHRSELLDLTFSDTLVQTGTDTLVVQRGAYLTLFVTVSGNASSSKINLGIQTNFDASANWYDSSLVSTDFGDASANVIPFTLRFDGDTQRKLRIPVDISGATHIRLTGQANDSAGTLQVSYKLSTHDAAGEVI
jgi:hypothetical protein